MAWEEGESQVQQDALFNFGLRTQWQVLQQKMKLNLSDDVPLAEFTTTLRKWISSVTLEAYAAKLFLLDTQIG